MVKNLTLETLREKKHIEKKIMSYTQILTGLCVFLVILLMADIRLRIEDKFAGELRVEEYEDNSIEESYENSQDIEPSEQPYREGPG